MPDLTLPGSYASVGLFTQTYTGIDVTVLKPGELARALDRSSRWVDRICKQTLYAQLDTVELYQDARPQGYSIDLSEDKLYLFPKKFPIRSITSLTQQYSASDNPAAVTPSWIHIEPSARFAWVEGSWTMFRDQLPRMYLVLAYVNGFAVSTLTADAAAAQPVLNLTPPPGQTAIQGFTPGQVLELQDATPETVTVLSVSGNQVTLTANLANPHSKDTMVIEPMFIGDLGFGDVQQATMLLTQWLLKTKGIAPLQLRNEEVQPARAGGPEQELIDEATELLEPFTVHA